jgi:hypothetical protein
LTVRGQGGGNQPLSSSDLDVCLPGEVGGARLVRTEVGDLAKTVLVQQSCYLSGEEPADERLAHFRGETGKSRRDLRGAAGQRGRRLVVGEHDTGAGPALRDRGERGVDGIEGEVHGHAHPGEDR